MRHLEIYLQEILNYPEKDLIVIFRYYNDRDFVTRRRKNERQKFLEVNSKFRNKELPYLSTQCLWPV